MSSSSDSEQYRVLRKNSYELKIIKLVQVELVELDIVENFQIVIPIQIIPKVVVHLILIVHQTAKPWQR